MMCDSSTQIISPAPMHPDNTEIQLLIEDLGNKVHQKSSNYIGNSQIRKIALSKKHIKQTKSSRADTNGYYQLFENGYRMIAAT